MSKEILLNKLEKQFSYYELVDEMKETINYSKIVDFLDNEKDQKIADLEAKLAESDKLKESYRLQNNEHHLQLCQFYSRLGVEAFGADIHEKALETLMIMKEEIKEKNGVRRALSACNRQNDEFADMIKKLVSEKEELKQQLAEKDKAIENWQTMYESVVQTCHNDKEEIERLNKQLETQENTITNLVEDNRASQEWYKKQLEEKEEQILWLKCDFAGAEATIEELKIRIIDLNQDKISFALEQLEKVKETLLNRYSDNIYQFSITNGTGKLTFSEEYLKIFINKEFYKQITTIKGEK